MFHISALKNGLPIVSCPMDDRESVALGIWIGAGGRWEPVKQSGISHFLEHLLFKGTTTRNCEVIKRSIEGIGGSLNGFTAEECTCYLTKIPKAHVADGLEILADMVRNAAFAPADIEMERGVICEEIKMYRDLPSHVVGDDLQTLLWPDHAIGRPLIGSPQTVGKISRGDLKAFLKRFYHPKNMAVIASGSLDHNALVEVCQKYLGSMRPGKHIGSKTVKITQKKTQRNYITKETEQTHLALGYHAFPRGHKESATTSILHTILGGNMSSRLFYQVREKRGLAYEIGTSIKRYSDTGAFVVHAGVDNSKVHQAVKIILNELTKITDKLVGKNELNRAKEFYRGQVKIGLEDTMDRMLWVGERVIMGKKLRDIDKVIAELDTVTPERIRRVAKQLFTTKRANMTVLGPLSKPALKKLDQVIGL